MRDVLRHTIRRTTQHLAEVNRGVGVVADAEEEDLRVELPGSPDGALEPMRWNRQRIARYAPSLGTERGERERVIGSHGAGPSPERVRDDAEVRRARRVGIEGIVVIARPGRHHDRSVRTDSL